MKNQLLHIFRNTPFGRETLMQSIYFCGLTKTFLKVYIPQNQQFLMYFQHEIATVLLNKSFLRSPATAQANATAIIHQAGGVPDFLVPTKFTASSLPDLPVEFGYICCPRSISDLSTKISLGYLGPKVRAIIKNATFPILIPTPVFKKWESVTVFFGGSHNAVKALKAGLKISRSSGLPLKIFTHAPRKSKSKYLERINQNGLGDVLTNDDCQWIFMQKGRFRDNLMAVPHDTLVVVGAYGHGVVKELALGSMMEKIQTHLPNNMLIVGPNCIFG